MPIIPRPAILVLAMICLPVLLLSQVYTFKGIVKDEQTLKPLAEVNISIPGTSQGTSTNKDGKFSLRISKLPSTLVFSCIGYENEEYQLKTFGHTTAEFLLTSKAYILKEVSISSRNFSFLFKDKEFSVLDYEFMDDKILLLVFRSVLKHSELILINLAGDTLALINPPEQPPSLLYKDFLGNLHYCSKAGSAFQCCFFRDSGIFGFSHKTTLDSLQNLFEPFIFTMCDKVYFQEKMASGFGAAFGYIEPGKGKKYIRKVINTKKIQEYTDDMQFYQNWNIHMGLYASNPNSIGVNATLPDEFAAYENPAFNFSIGDSNAKSFEKAEARARGFEFFNMTFPVIKISSNTLAFFNFGENNIEILDKEGNLLKTLPVSFHKGPGQDSGSSSGIRLAESGWHWENELISDKYNRSIYAVFRKGPLVRLRLINMETGKLNFGTILPVAFPFRIGIYSDEAFFLSKEKNDNVRLLKCKL